MPRSTCRSFIALSTLLAGHAALAGSASFQQITGAASANDLTPDGSIVVGQRQGGGGYYWTMDGGLVSIGGLDAVAVSDDGSTIFGTIADPDTGASRAAIWTARDGWTALPKFPLGLQCPSLTSAYELSADGSVAVGLAWDNGCQAHAAYWSGLDALLGLEYLANGSNRASVVSADGTVVGGFAQGTFDRTPAVWHADGTGFTIDPTEAAIGEVTGISDDGVTVLGVWNGSAFTWTEAEGLVLLGSLNPGWKAQPLDIDGTGTLVGFDLNFTTRFAWIKPNGLPFQDLKTYLTSLGATVAPTLEVAQAISTDGRVIIGHGFFSGAWIATLPGPDCPADLDGDGAVDGADLGELLSQWGGAGSADLDGSGTVDGADLGVLLAAWGACS
ncbi:MAG: hypothetical protein KDA22_02190 [Phycisphaerales bacterium]|nr:hypothetical protein [Phycisphaerales bacterium]